MLLNLFALGAASMCQLWRGDQVGVCHSDGMCSCTWLSVADSIWCGAHHVQEKVPVKGGRGAVNLLVKCKMCSRENSLGQPVIVYQL